ILLVMTTLTGGVIGYFFGNNSSSAHAADATANAYEAKETAAKANAKTAQVVTGGRMAVQRIEHVMKTMAPAQGMKPGDPMMDELQQVHAELSALMNTP